MIRLVDIKTIPQHWAVDLTWQLLEERPAEASISHRQIQMPTWKQHEDYVLNHPYVAWYAILNDDSIAVGTVLLTKHNEIGIAILLAYQRNGYAREAISEIMRMHDPAPAKPGERRGTFLANVNPNNQASIALFKSLGGRLIQFTYEMP